MTAISFSRDSASKGMPDLLSNICKNTEAA
jgi:hypothetical protein